MFMSDLPMHFDGLKAEILTHLDAAQEEFESIYPKFYDSLREELDLDGEVDFLRSNLYLDTYYSA